jgi:hypothetical protein
VGSIPITRSIHDLDSAVFAHVAQLVEHTLGKGEVTGSIPVMGSILFVVRAFGWA